VKYSYLCVVGNGRTTLIFETDELLIRGGFFRHAGEWYQVVDGPQPGVERSRVSVRQVT
jgi:hypothetical protein